MVRDVQDGKVEGRGMTDRRRKLKRAVISLNDFGIEVRTDNIVTYDLFTQERGQDRNVVMAELTYDELLDLREVIEVVLQHVLVERGEG